MTIWRVYENGKPLADQELPAVVDDRRRKKARRCSRRAIPGATQRLNTVAHLEFLRDSGAAAVDRRVHRIRDALEAYARQGAEQTRQANDEFFGIENSLKSWRGQIGGLQGRGDDEQEARGLSRRCAIASTANRGVEGEVRRRLGPGGGGARGAPSVQPRARLLRKRPRALHAVLHATRARWCAGPTRAQSRTASGCPSTPTPASRRDRAPDGIRSADLSRRSSRPSSKPALTIMLVDKLGADASARQADPCRQDAEGQGRGARGRHEARRCGGAQGTVRGRQGRRRGVERIPSSSSRGCIDARARELRTQLRQRSARRRARCLREDRAGRVRDARRRGLSGWHLHPAPVVRPGARATWRTASR